MCEKVSVCVCVCERERVRVFACVHVYGCVYLCLGVIEMILTNIIIAYLMTVKYANIINSLFLKSHYF